MERQAHTLSKPQRETKPEYCIFLDTETDQIRRNDNKIEQHLRLGVAIFKRYRKDQKTTTTDVCKFKTDEEFWSFVESKVQQKTILYLFAHNAVFDFTVVQHMAHLTRMGYRCLFVFDNQSTFIAKWRKDKHSIMILNTANWFKGSVEKWGNELGLPKLRMPQANASDEDWFTYCQQDTEILVGLHEWYTKFLEENNLGPWKYTIASEAFSAYRFRFMNHPIHIPNDLEETRLARESYHGGRTEVFRVGEYEEDTYYKVDVNSMYPSVMKAYGYPSALEYTGDGMRLEQLEYLLKQHCIIADVVVNTPQPFYVRLKDDRNVYPVGEFRTTLTTEELRLSLNNGWLETIHGYAVYRKRDLFGAYVDFFYGLKERYSRDGQELLKSYAKLYLNSLYGKFGQRGYKDEVIGELEEEQLRVSFGISAETHERYMIRQIGKVLMYSSKEGESYNSFCAIASHVTGNARLALYLLVMQAGRQNCFYCDTDSLIVSSLGMKRLENLLDNFKIGYLKIEGKCGTINIVAPKHYLFDEHWTIKGVRHTAKQVGPNQYQQEIWPGFNSILKSGREIYVNPIQTKVLTPTIVTGIVGTEGFVWPFVYEGNELCYAITNSN